MLEGTPILVSAARGDDRAGVRRDGDGELWIAHWDVDRPDRVGGTRLEGLDPARIGGPGWWAVGGRLPPRAATVHARGDGGTWYAAAVAEGAWVVFVDGSEQQLGIPPLRMLDAAGALVSRAAPGWIEAARPLTPQEAELIAKGPHELGGACPACGRQDWRATPAGSGERVFCARCGHNDGAISVFVSASAP